MLDLDTKHDGNTSTVLVKGEVDLESSPELWTDLQQTVKTDRLVRIDLSGVDYMDSTGVAVLVRALKQAQQVNASITLVHPSPRVQAVLDLARLSQLFTIEKSEG